MSQWRKDPIVGRWVIVAANRAQRPNAFVTSRRWDGNRPCPFCEGHEDETPGEVFAYRAPPIERDHPGWRVRVVPNKYPALGPDGSAQWRTEGMFQVIDGIGAHEVIVESPRHLVSTSQLSAEQLAEVFAAYRQRLLAWKDDPRLVYGMIFKNVGEAAGASLEHTHSQLIATPIVPITVSEEMAGALAFYRERRRCVYCAMIDRERADAVRIVLETPDFVALSPFAARFPFETWVLPKRHASHYESTPETGLSELAGIVRRLIRKIESELDRPAYNYFVHTAPFDITDAAHYHWHIEVIPSLTKAAGFEWGSGYFVNPVPPEEAAARLLQAKEA